MAMAGGRSSLLPHEPIIAEPGNQMDNVTYILAILVMFAVAVVLVRGLFNMMRGGDANLSNKLMQMRVLLQFIAIVLIVLTLWLTGGGR